MHIVHQKLILLQTPMKCMGNRSQVVFEINFHLNRDLLSVPSLLMISIWLIEINLKQFKMTKHWLIIQSFQFGYKLNHKCGPCIDSVML